MQWVLLLLLSQAKGPTVTPSAAPQEVDECVEQVCRHSGLLLLLQLQLCIQSMDPGHPGKAGQGKAVQMVCMCSTGKVSV
jgi:hypothetical protein